MLVSERLREREIVCLCVHLFVCLKWFCQAKFYVGNQSNNRLVVGHIFILEESLNHLTSCLR